ncbi:MAG: glycosyltransferase family 4 protein [Pseudomonadota bacterium]
MRVIYYHQHFSTPHGSGGTRSYELAQHLVAGGHDVTMVCGSYDVSSTGLDSPFVRGRRAGMVDGIRVIEYQLPYSNADSFLARSWSFLRFAARSTWLAMTERYDLVFATSTPLTAGIPGIVARWLRRKPFVFEVRDLWPELPREMGVIRNPLVLGAMGVLEWVSYRSAHACIGLSPGIVAGIERRLGKPKPVYMIPNGCDLDLFAPRAVADDVIPGVGARDFVAIFTGAHGMANGLDAVLDAAAELKARDDTRRIKLVFVGKGKCKPDLVRRAKEEDLSHCLFLDPVPKTELVGYLQRADVGLMILDDVPAFYFGTSPNKFFDYLASGLPVLTNYPGWLCELIGEHQCGVAVPPGDASAFADALQQLSAEPETLTAMGRRGRQLGGTSFARQALGERFARAIEATIDAHRGAA